MSILKKMAIISDNCVACGSCLKICPLNALSVQNGMYAVVDKNRCIGCGKCVNACPAGIISVVLQRGMDDDA